MTGFPEPLLRGYRSFRDDRYAREQDRYRSLAEQGQAPETMVIACCDSRAAPETIFNAAPGELFVVRNVANLVPPCEPGDICHSTSAALEFAVQSLKVRQIVVLGHGRCGGIRAALHPAAEPLSPGEFFGRGGELRGRAPGRRGGIRAALPRAADPLSPDDFIGRWMNRLGPAAEAVVSSPELTEEERQTALERASISQSIANLRTFPFVSILEDRKRLGLHGAWFDIAEGELWTMDPETGDFSRAE